MDIGLGLDMIKELFFKLQVTKHIKNNQFVNFRIGILYFYTQVMEIFSFKTH